MTLNQFNNKQDESNEEEFKDIDVSVMAYDFEYEKEK